MPALAALGGLIGLASDRLSRWPAGRQRPDRRMHYGFPPMLVEHAAAAIAVSRRSLLAGFDALGRPAGASAERVGAILPAMSIDSRRFATLQASRDHRRPGYRRR